MNTPSPSPAAPSARTAWSEAPEGQPAMKEFPGLLVVDGDPHDRAALRACLEHRGFRVYVAADAFDAAELFQELRQQIALVLIDVHRSSTGAAEVFEALRQIDPQVPCCFMLGPREAVPRDELLRRGACAVVRKPFDALHFAGALVRRGVIAH